MNFTLSTENSQVVLAHLIRKSRYTLSIRGFTKFGDGDVLEYNFTTLGKFIIIIYLPYSNVNLKSSVIVQ